MNKVVTGRWILAGVLGFGVPALVVPVAARAADRDRAGRDRDVEVKWDDLPRDVQDTILREGGDRKVHHVYDVTRDGRRFYRGVVVLKNGDQRIIRVAPGGKTLSVNEVPQADLARYKEEPTRAYEDYENRSYNRERRWEDSEARVNATAQHPETINWDEVPPRARVTMLRESGGVKPDQIIRYRERDNVLYQTNLPAGSGRVHMIQVLRNGDIYNEGDYGDGRRVENRDWKPRTVSVDDVPRRVMDAVDRAEPRARITHVDQARRTGGDIYTVEIDERGSDDVRYLTIRDDGKVLADVMDRGR